jgi:hypothetical protein
MLITFSCKAYANVTLFGDIGLQMLTMMGHSATVPGAILSSDVPKALRLLKAAIEVERNTPTPNEQEAVDEDDKDTFSEPPISLVNRALPLIELLSAAEQHSCNVMWEAVSS